MTQDGSASRPRSPMDVRIRVWISTTANPVFSAIRATFYNYFGDSDDLLDYCWTALSGDGRAFARPELHDCVHALLAGAERPEPRTTNHIVRAPGTPAGAVWRMRLRRMRPRAGCVGSAMAGNRWKLVRVGKILPSAVILVYDFLYSNKRSKCRRSDHGLPEH